MSQRGSELLEYSVFNKPTKITGTTTSYLTYGPDHQLFKEVSNGKTIYKLGGYEIEISGTQTVQKSYVDGSILNSRTLVNNQLTTNTFFYLHMDYLGSLESTTDENGTLVNRASFDAWGNRRKPNWETGNPTETFVTSTGFTGHHQLDAHNLVHMGGRVYDPALSRFLSADILVQAPYDTQSFNRYSYVLNNPLSLNDPSGYCSGAPDTFSQIMRDQMEANIEAAHISFTIDTMIRINNQIIATATKKGTLHKVGLLKTGKGTRKNASAKVRFVKEANKELEGSGLTVNEDATAILDSSGNIVGILELDLASGSVASIRLNSGYELVNSPAGEMTKQKGISWGGSENGCLLAGWSCSGELRYGDITELIITARPSALGNMLGAIDILTSINPYRLLTKGLFKRQLKNNFIDCLRCFAAGTEILTEDGFKPIETLKVGDLVWAHDPETGETALKPIVNAVVNTKDSLWELELEKEGKQYLHEVTGSHPYYVIGKSWTEVENLQIGDLIKTKDGKPAKVKSLKDTGVVTTTYNFEVKDINTYYVSAAMVLVHNNCGRIFGSFNGMTTSHVLKNIPNGWKKLPSNNKKGWKLVDENGIERIRFTRPQKGHVDYERMKQGYWRRQDAEGRFLDVDGNVVPESHPNFKFLTHIPYTGP